MRKAVAKPGDHTIVLTWVPPAAADLAYIEVKRSIAGAPGRETLVYKGLKRTLKSRGLRNDVTYRFVLVAYDKAGNSSSVDCRDRKTGGAPARASEGERKGR